MITSFSLSQFELEYILPGDKKKAPYQYRRHSECIVRWLQSQGNREKEREKADAVNWTVEGGQKTSVLPPLSPT